MRDRLEWMRQGLCTQTDPELFFPEGQKGAKPAKAVCSRCPVFSQCYVWTMTELPPKYEGVYAGTTDWDRRQIKRREAA